MMVSKKVNCFSTVKNPNILHKITKPIILISRCFGVFPVTGLLCPTPKKLRFTIKSPYILLCIASVVGQALLCIVSLVHLVYNGANPRNFYKFVINSGGIICTLLIQKLAMNWPRLVQDAALIEQSLPKHSLKSKSTSCNMIAAIVFFCALAELFLGFNFYWKLADACYKGDSQMESYYLYTMPAASVFIPYTHWSFVLLQILNIQIMFVTTFTDVLIMTVSLHLTSYFEELNDLIVLYKHKYPSIWNVLRVHYTKLTRLVKLVDDNISPFILFSFGSNLLTLCVQLFKILRKDLAHAIVGCNEDKAKSTIDSFNRSAYFTFSFAFLFKRALVTALIPARLHSTAQAPIRELYEVPTSCYSGEAHRFLEQMRANTVALSGLHFFYVTRRMILSLAATMLTYELVLIQFSYNY